MVPCAGLCRLQTMYRQQATVPRRKDASGLLVVRAMTI